MTHKDIDLDDEAEEAIWILRRQFGFYNHSEAVKFAVAMVAYNLPVDHIRVRPERKRGRTSPKPAKPITVEMSL